MPADPTGRSFKSPAARTRGDAAGATGLPVTSRWWRCDAALVRSPQSTHAGLLAELPLGS